MCFTPSPSVASIWGDGSAGLSGCSTGTASRQRRQEATWKGLAAEAGRWVGEADGEDSTDKAMAVLATMVGAMVLSRAVNNKRLSKRLLQAASKDVLARSSGTGATRGSVQ